jgi:type VI secretion system Hcp family effector
MSDDSRPGVMPYHHALVLLVGEADVYDGVMASQYYGKIKGAMQGTFRGDSTTPNRHNWIEIQGYEVGVQSPFDAATGQASGKRQHQPVIITKPKGASTPLLIQAWQMKEPLTEVVIEGTEPGSESVHDRITLTNAQITTYTATHGGSNFTIVFKDIQKGPTK